MPRNYGAYRLGDDDFVTPEAFNDRFKDIDGRIAVLEDNQANADKVVLELRQLGLQRINEVLAPAFEELKAITSLGALFRTTSASSVSIGTGEKTFVIAEIDWKNFAPAGYLIALSASDPDSGMSGRFESYDPDTGTLIVDVEIANGEGSLNDWIIMVGALPDLSHNGRTDNPHGVTAEQVGAPTAAAVTAALSGKSNVGHGHATSDVTGLDAALASKLDATATAADSTKWGGRTLTVSAGDPSGGIDGDIWFKYE